MKVLAIQHDAADTPGAAGEIVERLGHTLDIVRIERGDKIPSTVDADLMMSFGGGVSLSSGDFPAWVTDEQNLMLQYMNAGRRLVGICLGGQMIAAALGCQIRRNREVEVGWHPVEQVEGTDETIATGLFPDPCMVLHWHQDTFDIPPGGTHFLRSEACDNQAFVIDNRIFGFQFHLEANDQTVNVFNKVSPLRRREGPYVQSEQRVIDGIGTYLPVQIAILESLLGRLLS
jgi:GMP synthase-like glutamine amidotransferase